MYFITNGIFLITSMIRIFIIIKNTLYNHQLYDIYFQYFL